MALIWHSPTSRLVRETIMTQIMLVLGSAQTDGTFHMCLSLKIRRYVNFMLADSVATKYSVRKFLNFYETARPAVSQF